MVVKILNLCDSNRWKKRISNVDLTTINYPVDKTKERNDSDIVFNLNTASDLPIGDNTFDIVYSSHTLEHIREEHLEGVVRNVHRVLKPGGLFRVIVPDFLKSVNELRRSNLRFFEEVNNEVGTGKGSNIVDRFSRFNISYIKGGVAMGPKLDKSDVSVVMRGGPEDIRRLMLARIPVGADYYGHVNIIEKTYLIQLLSKCMFRNVKELGFGESSSPICRNSDMFNNRPNCSIYVECMK